MVPDDLDALLTRDSTAEALTAAGFPIKSATLATMAARGGGPGFQTWGGKPLYRWGDALDWAKGRLSTPKVHPAEEQGYRRGYQQGAHAAFQSHASREAIETWITVDLFQWRYGQPNDKKVYPPQPPHPREA
jgi:hypothetical protein